MELLYAFNVLNFQRNYCMKKGTFTMKSCITKGFSGYANLQKK